MLGKILSQLLGNGGEEAAEDAYQELMELEEEGWVIVNLPGERRTEGLFLIISASVQLTVGHKPPVSHTENEALSAPEADPLENLLIEHPSMSVYQMRRRMSAAEEGELGDQEEGEEEEDASR